MRTPRASTLTLAALVVLLAAPAATHAAGLCLSAELPWSVLLPDGSAHPAGTLRVCHTADFTPVTGIEQIAVAGKPAGRFLARLGRSEGEGDQTPILVFSRVDRDHMRLIGFAFPAGDGRMRTVLFRGRQDEPILLSALSRSGGPNAGAPAILTASLR